MTLNFKFGRQVGKAYMSSQRYEIPFFKVNSARFSKEETYYTTYEGQKTYHTIDFEGDKISICDSCGQDGAHRTCVWCSSEICGSCPVCIPSIYGTPYLSSYRMPLTKIIEDNSIEDMQRNIDNTILGGWRAYTEIGEGIVNTRGIAKAILK